MSTTKPVNVYVVMLGAFLGVAAGASHLLASRFLAEGAARTAVSIFAIAAASTTLLIGLRYAPTERKGLFLLGCVGLAAVVILLNLLFLG